MIRMAIKGEKISGGIQDMDKLMIIYALVSVVAMTILEKTGKAFINRSGLAFDLIGTYFLFRSFLLDLSDIKYLIKATAVIIIPLAMLIAMEKLTSRNYFFLLSKDPAEVVVRDGKIRAMGPFLHPILAGTFAATISPLLFTLWWQGKRSKILCVLSLIGTISIIVSCASSGPIMSFGFCIIGFIAWRFRNIMPTMRYLIVLLIICLQLTMKGPVWYLLAKIDLTGSSTGWYRAELISSAIAHFNEWWMVGTSYTRHWMATGTFWTSNQCDIVNQYIAIGINGGLLLLLIFIRIIMLCYKKIGILMTVGKNDEMRNKIIPWSIGVSLFSHVITFFSVSYFDQNIEFVYLLFALATILMVQKNRDIGEPNFVAELKKKDE